MKRVFLLWMCLLAMLSASTSVKAQEVTITLTPGWTWMSFPTADTVDFGTALGDFTPMQGDVIKSQWGQATYINGQWRGGISQFYPGYGYHYKSNRTEPVSVTLNAQPDPYGGDHDYVDLGLPSGNLWATCNVGAQEPWEYGVYFAWGETLPKDSYDWFNYQYSYGANSDHPNLTKYCNDPIFGYDCFFDTLTTLLPEDDAATANWGADWRMPTFDEWMELYQYTSPAWTTQNGVYGVRYTASNGNSIFLPAAGVYNGGTLSDAESLGDYWSSSLCTDFPGSAWHIMILSGNNYAVGTSLRYRGASVRAVRSGSQSTSFVINAIANPAEGGEVSGVGTYEQGQSCTLTATPNEGYTFTNWTENGEVVSADAVYTFAVDADRTLVANFVHSYVDLGLPSGTLWATCNLGANVPEDYGDYFAWGETQPKDNYDWINYQYSNDGNSDYPNLTKYCTNSSFGYNGFYDDLTTLLPEDDAATANWGADWRMPTFDEWMELYQYTNLSWTTQNGVYGVRYTASNGNSIFLPAAGHYIGSYLIDSESLGDYWSSSLSTDFPGSAWNIMIRSGNNYFVGTSLRYRGASVRAVRSSGQN